MHTTGNESNANDKSLETDIESNVRELRPVGTSFLQIDDADDGISANELSSLLGQVSEVSTREIDNLIGELRGLREKLETDYDRLKGHFAEYARLNDGVMQLTSIIFDKVDRLPSVSEN
jgi:hypothetical protein